MSLYEIVFAGELVPGAPLDQVKSNLAKLFQADAQRIEVLFSGRRLVLKNNLDSANAEKYRSTLARAGAQATVEPMAVEVEEIEMAAPPPVDDAPPVARTGRRAEVQPRDAYMAAFSEVDAPDFDIAAVGADLQEAPDRPRPPTLDLDQFSLAPAGSDMGQARTQIQARVPDTSHLKIIG